MRMLFFGNPNSEHTRRIVAGLIASGATVDFGSDLPGELPGTRRIEYVVPELNWLWPRRWLKRKHLYCKKLLSEYDLIAVHFVLNWGFTADMMDAGRLAVTPWGSDVSPPRLGPQPSAKALENRRRMLRVAHSVSALSGGFRDVIADFAGIDADGIDIVPIGVDTEVFKPQATSEGSPVVGYFKGFGYAYGADHFIRAMPEIAAAVPDVRFELMGRGPLLDDCRRLVDELGMSDRVVWRDRLEHHEDLPSVVGHWTVSVMPSESESFGVAALECQAMGVPVVASDVVGFVESVVDGETGLLTPVGDSEAIAQKVVVLLKDADKRREMGIAGRRFVQEHYEWRDCMEKWVQFYERAALVAV